MKSTALIMDFNPRFPWGKRRSIGFNLLIPQKFQSTLPVGEATVGLGNADNTADISIHASRGGSDRYRYEIYSFDYGFQSTLPVGEATPVPRVPRRLRLYFNPRFPWGKRQRLHRRSSLTVYFNPRFPWGKRLFILFFKSIDGQISIHASRGGSDNPGRLPYTPY